MKLTKSQFKTLSTVIYNYLNGNGTPISDISAKHKELLYNSNLIDEVSSWSIIIPTNDGIQAYKENITKKKLFINNKNKEIKIEIYKVLDNDTYEFIYFFTKDKTGGGKITLKELCEEYIVMD